MLGLPPSHSFRIGEIQQEAAFEPALRAAERLAGRHHYAVMIFDRIRNILLRLWILPIWRQA